VPIVSDNALHVPLKIPADRLALLVGSMREPSILESGPGFGEPGRWSLFAAEPLFRFESSGNRWTIHHDRTRIDRDMLTGRCDPNYGPLRVLDLELAEFGIDTYEATNSDPELPPFHGGFLGFFGYDLAPSLERLPRKAPADSRLPDVCFGFYDTVITHDRLTGSVVLSAYDVLGEGHDSLRARVDRWLHILDQPVFLPSRTNLNSPITSNFSRTAYLDAIGRVLEYIRDGDVFQVNLSQRFSAHGRIEPLDLYLRLRDSSPAPFSAFLRWDDLAVISASPEMFYRTRGDKIVTRPIKGTRPRGKTPEDDARLARELQASAKDQAELTMIVDLERNDLGRVCAYGTVKVTESLAVESFAQVHHLVATIEGQIRPDVVPVDVVRAMFPGGSITGAPKIRAMEIIDELEPTRRSLYTGAIGYFSRCGNSAFNIAIRTMLVQGDRVSYQVGGGIVADSDPENEYEETLHKGRGLRNILEERGPDR